jgi:DNA-binding XRE family transcriptional regulator
MRASSRLPTEQRPIKYTASGFQQAREDAGLTRGEVAEISGYSVGVIAQIEAGYPFHTLTVSRASSAIPNHDLAEIRDEG